MRNYPVIEVGQADLIVAMPFLANLAVTLAGRIAAHEPPLSAPRISTSATSKA
jgi:hypothetical protein